MRCNDDLSIGKLTDVDEVDKGLLLRIMVSEVDAHPGLAPPPLIPCGDTSAYSSSEMPEANEGVSLIAGAGRPGGAEVGLLRCGLCPVLVRVHLIIALASALFFCCNAKRERKFRREGLKGRGRVAARIMHKERVSVLVGSSFESISCSAWREQGRH